MRRMELRADNDLYNRIEETASVDGRSLSKQMVYLLRLALLMWDETMEEKKGQQRRVAG